ncbi:MAG TPA: DUF6489 family protein [Alphaproteobacteria bacterium]
MKFTVDVDCTPDEARTFLGLPDVKPMQEEMMAIMRDKVVENMKLMEPDKAMAMWAPMMNKGMANIHEFFSAVMTGAANGMNTGTSKKNK